MENYLSNVNKDSAIRGETIIISDEEDGYNVVLLRCPIVAPILL